MGGSSSLCNSHLIKKFQKGYGIFPCQSCHFFEFSNRKLFLPGIPYFPDELIEPPGMKDKSVPSKYDLLPLGKKSEHFVQPFGRETKGFLQLIQGYRLEFVFEIRLFQLFEDFFLFRQ